jgi:hypothetical protein
MIEDGTVAGEGLTYLESFTYFVVAPTVLFVVISFFAYITAKEVRGKKKGSQTHFTILSSFFTYLLPAP